MSKIVDIHCHHQSDDPNIIEVLVADNETLFLAPPLSECLICVGLHPWNVEQIPIEKFLPLLKQYLSHPKFFALGEIGLDKVSDTDYKLQMKAFTEQLQLAVYLKIPRIIIHSVKAHSDILQKLKESKYQGKILIHDFYANIETATQYLKHDCYFSFGKKLFTNSNAQDVIQKIPLERIFLETDDQLDFNIFDIYDQASSLLKLAKDQLIQKLYSNYQLFSNQ